MNRDYLVLPVLLGFAACGPAGFPTGVFQMTFQETNSTCNEGGLQTDPLTVTIDVDDDGTYVLTILGGQVPAASQSAEHVTFVLAPTPATIGQCAYDETDTLTLSTHGQNFTGVVQQNETDSSGSCAGCTITQSVIGTKTGN